MQKGILKFLPSALIFSPAAGLLFNILIEFSGLKSITGYNAVYESIMNKPVLMIILLNCVIYPIAEELLFRGLIYRLLLRRRFKMLSAALISSVFFGLYHGNLVQFVYAFVMGIFFALLLELSGTLFIPVISHMANNVLALIVSYGITDIIYNDKKSLMVTVIILSLLTIYWLYLLSRFIKGSGREKNG